MKFPAFIFVLVFSLAACRVSKKSEQVRNREVMDVIHVRDSIIRIPGAEAGFNFQYHQLLHLFDSLQSKGQKPQLVVPGSGNNTLRLTALPGGAIRAECASADSLLKIILRDRHRTETNEASSSTVVVRSPWWMYPAIIGFAAIIIILLFFNILQFLRR